MTAALWPPRRPDDYDRWYPPAWTVRALCAEVGGDLFFPERGEPSSHAKQICAACEVRAECLDYALETHQTFGIWGGASEFERRRMRREDRQHGRAA